MPQFEGLTLAPRRRSTMYERGVRLPAPPPTPAPLRTEVIAPEPPPELSLPPYRDGLPEYEAERSRQVPMPTRRPKLGPGAYSVGEEEYAPSTWQQLVGAAASGWLGGAEGPEAGRRAYSQAFEAPYAQAMEQYGLEEGGRRQRLSELVPMIEAQEARGRLAATAPLTRYGLETQRIGEARQRDEMLAPKVFSTGSYDPRTGAFTPFPRSDTSLTETELFQQDPEAYRKLRQIQRETGAVSEPRPSFDDSQIIGSLRAKLQREPTEAEFLAEKQRLLAENRPKPQPSMRLIRTRDPQTGETIQQFVPVEEGAKYSLAAPEGTRNLEEDRASIARSVPFLKAITTKLITQTGPTQRVQSLYRRGAAFLGSDPDYRNYTDAVDSLSLAVASILNRGRPTEPDRIMSARLFPDPLRDTTETAPVKWALLELMLQMPESELANLPEGAANLPPEKLLEILQNIRQGKPAAPQPTGGQGGGVEREEFSPSRNQYRHTLDGGQTWRSGRLPK